MIDLHNHIIYGVDDGSRSLEESVEMARQFVELGVNRLVATPHYRPSQAFVGERDMMRERLGAIQEAVNREGLDLQMDLGNELYYCPEILPLLKEGRLSPYGDSHYILLEMPFRQEPVGMSAFLYELQMAGYIPLLAHVERYFYVTDSPSWLDPWLNKGCYVQCNLSSLTEEGSPAYATIVELLHQGKVHVFAGDCHQAEWRSPAGQQAGIRELRYLVGENGIKELLEENPKRLLENKRLLSTAYAVEGKSTKKKQKKGFFSFFRRNKGQ